ncbi:MAG: hypothetical protein HGA36_01250 [Candidatus Moranbacteria bacterium]|nr:hypothetical protein [Candidatus Moranbacteria bacterium]
MKKIIIVSIVLLLPLRAFASENWTLKENKNMLSLEGSCKGQGVKIELYPAGKGESVYSANAACKDGKFQFSDNLLQWSNLSEGEYEVVLNEKVNEVKKIEIKRPVAVIDAVVELEAEKVIEEEVKSPEIQFLGAFVTLQKTILDMRNWLAQTQYPSFMKISLNFALDGVDLAVGKVSNLVLSGENSKKESIESLESIAPVAEVSDLQMTEEKNVSEVVEAAQDEQVMQEEDVAENGAALTTQ